MDQLFQLVKLGTPIKQRAASQAVARGRLSEPGNQAPSYPFTA